MNQPTMFYFGPWDRAGHFLCDETGRTVLHRPEARGTFPWADWEIDGKLQPHRSGCDRRSYCGCGSSPEGQALIYHKDGWTALSFWDRSVDTRGACNSTYFAEGTYTFEQMVGMAKTRFAERWNCMKFEVIEVE